MTVSTFRLLALLCVVFSETSRAQSSNLLEAVRLRRPEARELAVTELEECRKRKCERLQPLALLVGFLTVSEGDPSGAVQVLAAHPAPPGLEALHAYYLGQSYFYAGRPLDAARQFEAAARTSPRWLESKL